MVNVEKMDNTDFIQCASCLKSTEDNRNIYKIEVGKTWNQTTILKLCNKCLRQMNYEISDIFNSNVVKYRIGDIVRTKIHYQNDMRKEADGIIIGIDFKYETGQVKYRIKFPPDERSKEMGSTGCEGYVCQDDILELL